MGTTADKLNKILESKAAIKAAIEAKGVSDVGDVLAEYPDKIASISGGSGKFVVPDGLKFGYSEAFDATQFDTSQLTDMSRLFISYQGTSLDLSSWDTSNVTDMNSMFSECMKITSLDLSSLNVDNVTNMANLFYYCSDAKSINLTGWNTSNVTDMNSMFSYCNALTSIDDISGFRDLDMSNVTKIEYMFSSCNKLTSVDLTLNAPMLTSTVSMFGGCEELTSVIINSPSNPKLTSMDYMFNYCNKLTDVDLSNFDISNVRNFDYIFLECPSLVNLKLKGIGEYSETSSSGLTLDLTSCAALSKESVLYLFNNAFDRKTAGYTSAFTIKLNATTKALLTEDEIAIATNKGFTVV